MHIVSITRLYAGWLVPTGCLQNGALLVYMSSLAYTTEHVIRRPCTGITFRMQLSVMVATMRVSRGRPRTGDAGCRHYRGPPGPDWDWARNFGLKWGNAAMLPLK